MSQLLNICLCCMIGLCIRWCISLNSYSGAGKAPMFGDYEAQRHWMELTINLPVDQWYVNTTENDLMYWGLDYPPLTAYHSWIMGHIANKLNSSWVALHSSRGMESYTHKLFMRYSVAIVDMLVYIPAVLAYYSFNKRMGNQEQKLSISLLALLYPGLILIDYGHFQYNCVSLGFFLWAVVSLSQGHDLIGSVMFVMALNYKHMELYHATPFFFYLLGSCFKNTKEFWLLKLIKLAVVVLAAFALCWLPFLKSTDSALLVLHRLFPFARGLYEDKVANFWCSLSLVIKVKHILTQEQILKLCLGTSLLGLLPSSVDLLVRPSITRFKYALVNASLVFFLFSFQVHEKSILIPAISVCLLLPDIPFQCVWFLIISTFSMLPLLAKDGLVLAFLASTVLFYMVYLWVCKDGHITQRIDLPWKIMFWLSMLGAVLLTVLTFMTPPPRLPDLWPVLVSAYSCGHFLIFLAYFHLQQFIVKDQIEPRTPRRVHRISESRSSTKKKKVPTATLR